MTYVDMKSKIKLQKIKNSTIAVGGCCQKPYLIKTLVGILPSISTPTEDSFELREDGGRELREDGGFELRQ